MQEGHIVKLAQVDINSEPDLQYHLPPKMMVSQLSLSVCRTSFLGAYSDMSIGLHKVSCINHPSSSPHPQTDTKLATKGYQFMPHRLKLVNSFFDWSPQNHLWSRSMDGTLSPSAGWIRPMCGWPGRTLRTPPCHIPSASSTSSQRESLFSSKRFLGMAV